MARPKTTETLAVQVTVVPNTPSRKAANSSGIERMMKASRAYSMARVVVPSDKSRVLQNALASLPHTIDCSRVVR